MWAIIEERKNGPFKSFQDLEKRVKGLSDAKKMIAKRVVMELEGVDKYRAFVRPPSRHGDVE
jgi:putative nucleotide binding protein